MYLQHRQAWKKKKRTRTNEEKKRIRKYEKTRKMKYGNNSLSWNTTTRIKLDKWIFIQIVRQHMLSVIILLSQFARLSFSNHNEMRLPSATIQMENNRNDDTTTGKKADIRYNRCLWNFLRIHSIANAYINSKLIVVANGIPFVDCDCDCDCQQLIEILLVLFSSLGLLVWWRA